MPNLRAFSWLLPHSLVAGCVRTCFATDCSQPEHHCLGQGVQEGMCCEGHRQLQCQAVVCTTDKGGDPCAGPEGVAGMYCAECSAPHTAHCAERALA